MVRLFICPSVAAQQQHRRMLLLLLRYNIICSFSRQRCLSSSGKAPPCLVTEPPPQPQQHIFATSNDTTTVPIDSTPTAVAAAPVAPTAAFAPVAPPPTTTTTTPFPTSRPVNIKERTRRTSKTVASATRTLPPMNTKVLSSGHPAHHFMSGGMPCDPAPPKYSLAEYGEESLYTLILLRHGESEWNQRNLYTGWCDVNLTDRGQAEARTAGRLLLSNGIEIDQAFTSVLRRASSSCQMALEEAEQHWVPVTKTWRLNERHYGALQGYHKDTAYQELQLDQELVMQMRRAYDVRPPRMEDSHPYWHGLDRRYQHLTSEQLERSRAESLKDAAERILPFFHSVICPSIQSGKKCLIVSHANTIRTLVKHIDNISDEDIKGMTIPTGIPLLYRLDKDLKPVDPHIELEFKYMVEPKGYTWGTSHAHGFHGVYLGDLVRLQEIQRKRDATNRDWQRIVLRNIAKSLGLGELGGRNVIETRQLWWQIHQKMQSPEYGNMLLLIRMLHCMEDLMDNRKQKYITHTSYENWIQKIHLDTEGFAVEPFVELADKESRETRQQRWYESLAMDLEEEALIK